MVHAVPESQLEQQQTAKRRQAAGQNVGHDFREVFPAGEHHEQVDGQSREKGRNAVRQASAKKIAEAGAADAGSQNLQPARRIRQLFNLPQAGKGLRNRVLSLGNFPGNLVDGGYPSQMHRGKGHMADFRCVGHAVFCAAGKNSVGNGVYVKGFHVVRGGNPLHGLLHPEDLRSIGKQDPAGQHRQLQRAVVIFCHSVSIPFLDAAVFWKTNISLSEDLFAY